MPKLIKNLHPVSQVSDSGEEKDVNMVPEIAHAFRTASDIPTESGTPNAKKMPGWTTMPKDYDGRARWFF